MRIAFNPSTVAALTTPPNNKDITFDLRGRNIFARGVKFYGTDTNTWRPVVDNLTSNSTTSSLSANQGRVLKALIDGKSDSGHNHDGRYVRYYAVTTLDCNNLAVGLTAARVSATNAAHTNNSVYLYISDIGTPFQIQIPDSNVPYIYKRYYSSGKWSGWFKLNAGYADSAGSVAWANITGKPSSYTPSAHTHAWNSLTHSSTTENQAILTNGKANGWKLYTLNISGWNNAANNAHSHSNKSVLDGITSGLVSNWNTAYTFVHTITGTDTDKVINKWDEIVNFLAGITEDNKLNTLLNSKLSVYELADKTNVGTIKNNGIYYSTTDASSGTLTNSPFNTGFALINMTSYDGGDDLRRSRLAFNAFGEIKVSDDRGQSNTAETWYNVLTSKNSGISGSTIKLNGTSITVYSSGTADGRYVKKSGDTMTGVLTIDTTNFGTLTIKRNDDANGASIQFRGKSSVYGYIGLNNSTKDKQFLRWNSDTSKVYTILDTSSTYTSSGKGVINGTTITQVDNATNATNSTNARKLVNWYSARPTSLNAQFGDGSLRIFYATSSTTEGKSPADATVLHLAWDNNGGWDSQLAIGHSSLDRVYLRSQNNGTWQPWKTLAFTTDIPSSLKNPHSLTLKANGTTLATYDGSSAKEANFTYANVGAASASHTHSYYAVNENYGGFKKAERLPTSGFYQSYISDKEESGGNAPWKSWVHLINCQHNNTGNNYALQIAASFFNNNIFKIRVTNDSVNTAWRDIIHSGNIGSQSVNYANSAGNSDKVDGYHATSSNKPWGTIPVITTSGYMDIGKHLEFHFDNTTGSDYSTILRCTGNHSNIVNLPSVAGTLALISDIPSSVKNPYSLTTFGVVYDGSSAKVVSPSNFINQLGEGTSVVTDGTMLITSYASNSGFADTNAVNIPYKRKAVHLWEYIKTKTDSLYATKSHNHDGRYVYNYGGTAANGQTLNQNALFMSTTSGITGNWWHILQAAWNGEYCWNSQIAFPTQNRNGMYYRSGLDDNTKWGSWVKLLDVNNYSSTLDSRYYTESEVNSLLSNKLNTSNFNWTNLPGKIVAGNEFNIVSAGFKEHMWFNYLPINDRSKTATISGYHFGNGARGYTSIIASGFIKSGGNASQLLRADGGVAAFNWSGQSGQPTWLWGGNSQHSYYVYNPSNFRVAYAASAGNADTLDGEHANSFVRAGAIDTDKTDLNALDTYSFIKSVNSEVADHSPKRNTGWYNVIQLVHRNGSGDGPGYIGQIALGMTSNTDDMFFRGKRTDSWKTVIHSGNISSQTVASASKLQTARNIALGTDLRGSANFDGSSNITINATINACTIGVGSTDTLHFKRIAHFETGSSWNDNALLLYISQGYINGSNGICRVEFRTDNISSSNSNPSASSSVRWLVRNGYNLDSLYAGYYVTTGKAYIDIYLKTTGGYQGTVIRVLQDSRGDINSNVQLINSYYHSDTNHKEAYNSVEAASTALYNRAYTRIVSGSDVGTVSHANSASNADTTDGVHIKWAGSLTSTSHLVAWEKDGSALRAINPANVSVGYASSAGNASTLGGTSLSGLFTAFGNNAHNITATIGGVTKSFLVNWAADSDKLDGKHASDFATAGHNHDGRYLRLDGSDTMKGVLHVIKDYCSDRYDGAINMNNSDIYGLNSIYTSDKSESQAEGIHFWRDKTHVDTLRMMDGKLLFTPNRLLGSSGTELTVLHTGNSSVSGHTITINGSSTTWSNTWRPIGTGASDAAAGNHTHKVKINGSEKIITATNAKDVVDLGTYLTSHQSLAGYVNTVETIGAGNAVTSIVKAGGKITANKGTTFLTSHQSLANYYTKGQVDAKLGKYLPLAGGTMNAGAQIQRTATGGMWYQGRSIALLRETSANGYHALWSLKTTDGSWDFGEYNSSGWNNIPVLSYVLDSNFNKGSNTTTYQIKFPLASGTIALTSNITNYYWANNKITSTSKIDAEVRVKNLGAGCSTTIENTIMATNWVRAMGNTGIYFQDHGGGLYMSDNTWIRTWGSKALYVNNTIRSINYQAMYGSTSVSAAKLENATDLVYGTDTSSQSISTYLRGTNVIMQVKKGTSTNYNALQLTSDRIYCNNYCDMRYSVEVRGDHFTVWNDSYLAQIIGSKVGIGTKNPQYTLDVGDKMRAGGYIHSGHNSNDAMLLAGGGWKKLSTLVEYPSDESYIYRKTTTEYDLRFVKLVNFNNLIYVDGWISADANGKSFTLGAKFKPYLYRDDHSIPTIVQMGWDDVVTIDGDGNVGFHIEGGRKKRIGFFYTGRA